MILQSLMQYYDTLASEGKIPAVGYCSAKVSYALNISDDGEVISVIPLIDKVERKAGKGKVKVVEVPRTLMIPEQSVRTVGVSANFLCDNAIYLLGLDSKGNASRAAQCYDVSKELHISLLDGADSPAAKAICAYFNSWDTSSAATHHVIAQYAEAFAAGGNIVFMHNGKFAFECSQIRKRWENHLQTQQTEPLRCLVTGDVAPYTQLHGKIKGVRGAQSVGASIVSYNARAYESYGKSESQGLNAPVSQHAASAYVNLLNMLLSDSKTHKQIGDATTVYWANTPEPQYVDFMNMSLEPVYPDKDDTQSPDPNVVLSDVFSRVSKAAPVGSYNEYNLDTPFYVLGLSPNAARISIRFFMRGTFGRFVKSIAQHYDDMSIVHAPYERDYIKISDLLKETVNPYSKDPTPSPLMSGEVMRSILDENVPYPTALYTAALSRIYAQPDDDDSYIKKVSYGRAAIIKAYLSRLKADNGYKYKEVLTVALNEQYDNRAYVLGRLFAVLENGQQDAMPDVNTTIKDQYFTSACATPRSVFPYLMKLSLHHTNKGEHGGSIEYRKRMLVSMLDPTAEPFPARHTPEEQGLFILGYYQQVQAFYTKKEDKTNEQPTDTKQV